MAIGSKELMPAELATLDDERLVVELKRDAIPRVVLNQHIRRRLLDDLGYGLALEGIAMMGR